MDIYSITSIPAPVGEEYPPPLTPRVGDDAQPGLLLRLSKSPKSCAFPNVAVVI